MCLHLFTYPPPPNPIFVKRLMKSPCFLCLCVPLSLLVMHSGHLAVCVPCLCVCFFFYAVRAVWKYSRRWVLPRSFCFLLMMMVGIEPRISLMLCYWCNRDHLGSLRRAEFVSCGRFLGDQVGMNTDILDIVAVSCMEHWQPHARLLRFSLFPSSKYRGSVW
jgi:hypothetical protein